LFFNGTKDPIEYYIFFMNGTIYRFVKLLYQKYGTVGSLKMNFKLLSIRGTQLLRGKTESKVGKA